LKPSFTAANDALPARTGGRQRVEVQTLAIFDQKPVRAHA